MWAESTTYWFDIRRFDLLLFNRGFGLQRDGQRKPRQRLSILGQRRHFGEAVPGAGE
jgi:hypothetical protein